MRRLAIHAAAAACAALLAGSASAQTFTVIRTPAAVPSYETPNEPGSIAVPVPLSTPPKRPAVRSYEELLGLWQRAGEAYGVPWRVLAAINKIESNFGRNMGPSSAGALGWMQFIPSSWERWGMDGDGDGLANPWNPDDAVYAAARYLAAAGAHEDLSRAIFAYNHAQWYVDEVLELAELFGAEDGLSFGAVGGSLDIFGLVGMEQALAEARRDVALASRVVQAAEARIEELDARTLELAQSAGDPWLSARAFARIERRLARAASELEQAPAELERRRAELDYAVSALDQVRLHATLPAPSLVAAPLSGDGYVFPVAGGPDSVSVAHDHHDYPAADIAAPEGSPLYALANAVVTDLYRSESEGGACGIGLKLRLSSGAVYVYCHLAYVEPSVVPGAALAAGAPVGLVGSTGNSTGPHLHLAFDPALSYPQDEPWFESFAGAAFTWQDGPTPAAEHPAETKAWKRVFTVVRQPVTGAAPRVVTFSR